MGSWKVADLEPELLGGHINLAEFWLPLASRLSVTRQHLRSLAEISLPGVPTNASIKSLDSQLCYSTTTKTALPLPQWNISFGETLVDFPAPGLLIFDEEYTVLTAFGARAVFLCPRDEQLDPARMEG